MAAITPEVVSEETQPKKQKRGRIEREQIKWGLIFLSPWLIGIVVFYLIPFIASFGFSLVEFNLAVPEDTSFVGLSNWRRALFDDPNTYESFGVTFLFAAISLPLTMAFALLLALLLNSKSVRGQAFFRTIVGMKNMVRKNA